LPSKKRQAEKLRRCQLRPPLQERQIFPLVSLFGVAPVKGDKNQFKVEHRQKPFPLCMIVGASFAIAIGEGVLAGNVGFLAFFCPAWRFIPATIRIRIAIVRIPA